jgi:dTDP-4-amino-4,6-dideoxygalactose transaminase
MIPYGHHSINEDDINAVAEVLRGDWLTTGPLVEKFEFELEKIVGAKCAVVSSGTSALHCAFAAIDLQPGDEVITPPITFIATQATAALSGASIVFADVLDDTANIDPTAVEAAITKKTKAIVAVDYAGHPADLSELRTIADKYGIYLIEDAAHSLGSIYKDQPVGSIADITTFSFFPTKNITSGEGGAIASNNEDLLLKAKRFGRQGMVKNRDEMVLEIDGPWHQEVHKFGLNYRLPDVLCALGISQLSRIQEFKKSRAELFSKYQEIFADNKNLRLPSKKNFVDPMWHLYPIRVPSEKRRETFIKLRENGIGVQVNYLPAHLHPIFAKNQIHPKSFPVAEKFYREEISLPMMSFNSQLDDKYFSRLAELLVIT